MRIRHAFTLFEVAISLLLVALAAITMFLVLPAGIRVQSQVRFKVIAAAKALEMMELMRANSPGMINDARDMDKEGIFPWDTRVAYRSMAPDMESFIASLRGSIRPLPEAIAYRLDSDNDEIRSLLDGGGQLYYFANQEPIGMLDADKQPAADKEWMALSRRLVVGVVGAPQQNAILYHPSVKAGPYQDFYPSPPSHGKENIRTRPTAGGNDGPLQLLVYDALCRDPAIAEVFQSGESTWSATIEHAGGSVLLRNQRFGYLPYAKEVGTWEGAGLKEAENPTSAATKGTLRFETCKRRAEAYVIAALWYAEQVGLPQSVLPATLANVDAFAQANAGPDQWRKVLAMRYLAHAAACLTRYYPWGFPAGGAPLAGSPAMTALMGTTDYATVAVTLDQIRAWHEATVRMAMLHADRAGPYHWGAPRPLNRQVMMDHPLVQLDLWTSPISADFPFEATPGVPFAGDAAPIVVAGRVMRRQWRALFPQPIREPGIPAMYPGRHRDTNGDGAVDPRDPALLANASLSDYPPRILDTDGDGCLDERDRPLPTPAVTTVTAPVLGDSAGLLALRQDLATNGQAAIGPTAHFNLTAPFQPCHRARQLVFWAVDWQSYEDFETQPSAAIDASRYPVVAPHPTRANARETAWSGHYVQRTDLSRQLGVDRGVGVNANSLRNPELIDCFRMPSLRDTANGGDPAGRPAKDTIFTVGEINDHGDGAENRLLNGQLPDIRWPKIQAQPTLAARFGLYDMEQWNMHVFLGLYGVNRDGVVARRDRNQTDDLEPLANPIEAKDRSIPEGRVDAGPVSRNVRMRAATVCRFVYYDPRVSGSPF